MNKLISATIISLLLTGSAIACGAPEETSDRDCGYKCSYSDTREDHSARSSDIQVATSCGYENCSKSGL